MSDKTQELSSPAPSVRIPDHDLVRCIGRGSYGEVWLARSAMGTYRAVKIVRRSAFKETRPFERELDGLRKFEPLSRSHEGFVDLLQVGQNEDQGYFYYVMELGDDQKTGQEIDPATFQPKTLATEIARRRRLPVEECLLLGFSLSGALGYLHEHGLLHRDIKPSNIIFVDGVPKLADVGSVTAIEDAVSYVGTEGFIPPEGPVSAQADVYGLGKVLYEAATGKDRHEFPQLPADLEGQPDAAVFLELNEIILKACETDRVKRYRSAKDLRDDLELLQKGRSLKRLHLLERRLAKAKRVGIGIGLFALLLGAISVPIARERRLAADARQRHLGAQLTKGTQAMGEGDLLGSLPFLVDALRLDEARNERTHRVRLGAVLEQCPKLVQMWFLDKQADWAEFTPDGRRVIIATWADYARVWDVQSGAAVSPPFGRAQGFAVVSLNPAGDRIITAGDHKSVSLWSTATGELIFRLAHPDRAGSASFSPDGRRFVTACNDKRARVWDAGTYALLREMGAHRDIVRHAAFSPDGRFIVTASQDHTAQMWDAQTGAKVGPPLTHQNWVYHAVFSPDGRRVVTASFDRTVRVWDAATGQELLPFMPHGDAVLCAVFSPDGCFMVSACSDGNVRLWDAATHQLVPLNPILKHSSQVMHAAFSPDGRRIVTACVDGTVRVWDLAASAVPAHPVPGTVGPAGQHCLTTSNTLAQVRDVCPGTNHYPCIVLKDPVQDAALSDNGRFLLALSAPTPEPTTDPHRRLQVWEVSVGKPLSPPVPCTNDLRQVCVSPEGRRFALFAGKTAQTYDLATGKVLSRPLAHPHLVTQAVFSPDGNRLLTVAQVRPPLIADASVCVWDAASGESLFPPFKHPFAVSHAEFSPDGLFFLTTTSDPYMNAHAAQVWNAATGERVGQPLKHRDGVLHASFSPDGRRVVTGSEDFTAMVRDAATGRRLVPRLRHSDQVKGTSWSGDGRWIVTASRDGTARLWDAQTGDPITPALRHQVSLRHARLLAQDSAILTVTDQGRAWLWNLPYEARPVDSLALLAQLLNGGQTESTSGDDGLLEGKPPNLSTVWQQLSLMHPEDRRVSEDDIMTWHSRLAELSEENRWWFAGRFHLDRLLALTPDDPTLAQRRAQADKELAKEQMTQAGVSASPVAP